MKNFKELLEGKKEMHVQMRCTKCPWVGSMADVHTDRGGHNFICPLCKNPVTETGK